MFTTRWKLFRLLGIPIYIDASWLLILALVTWAVSSNFLQILDHTGKEVRPGYSALIGFVTAVLYFACILLHELGHAVVGRAFGMRINGITLFLFGGVAELADEPPTPASEFFMAIAGPVVTLVLAGLCTGLGWAAPHGEWGVTAQFMLAYLATINWILLAFNMVPAFPLDGGRVLRSLLWGATGSLRRSTYWASLCGRAFAWFLMGVGVLMLFHVPANGIFFILIGMFLNNAARGSYEQVLIRQTLAGEPVDRFMNREPILVPPWINLRGWVEDYVYRYHRKAFPVADDGHLRGLITTQALANYPREEWDQHTVAEAMARDLSRVSISPRADALQALSQMQSTGSSRLLVTEGDRLLGIISLKDLLRFLNLKLRLEGPSEEKHLPPPGVEEPASSAHPPK